MDHPLFSIILPIYNVEKYLRRCIDSLLAQQFNDYELILVDDGATDGCPAICDEYAAAHECVSVVHKKNGGLSSARNAGLDRAHGEYILFIDSDDFVNNTSALSDLAKRIEERHEDIILFGCINREEKTGREYESRGNYDMALINRGDKVATLAYLAESGNFPGSAWIMTVKRSLIEKLGIRFPDGLTAEDYYWNSNLLCAAESVGAVNNQLYTYIKNRADSITSRPRLSGIKGMMLGVSEWLKNPQADQYMGITRFLARTYLIAVSSYCDLQDEDKSAAKQLLLENKQILKRSKQSLCSIFAHFIDIFGLSLSSKLIRFAYQKASKK